jgi:hypothetical protein
MYREVRWTDWTEAHICRHGVAPADVEEVLFDRPRWVAKGRDDTTLVFGSTRSGRLLLVVTANEGGGGRVRRDGTRDDGAGEADLSPEGAVIMGAMDQERLERLAEHYQSTDASADLDRAHYEGGVVAEPMVTTSLRLPKSIMDAVRGAADARKMRPTALMREWIERQLVERAAGGERLVPVSAVVAFLAENAVPGRVRSAVAVRHSAAVDHWSRRTHAAVSAQAGRRVAGRRRSQ